MLSIKDFTSVQAKNSKFYQKGDVIVPFKNNGRLRKDHLYCVSKVDSKGLIHLHNNHGASFSIDPQTFDLQVYSKSTLNIAKGDILEWRRNIPHGPLNRETAVVHKIENDLIHLNNGAKDYVISSKEMHFLDHAIVRTVYAAQGATADRVIAMSNGKTSKENWYVTLSRARKEAIVVTSSKDRLVKAIKVSSKKENALAELEMKASARENELSI